MNIKEIDLSKPAFGEGADPAADLVDAPSTDSQAEEEVEVTDTEADASDDAVEDADTDSVEEGQRVPYSRHANVVKARREAEALAQEAIEEAARWKALAEVRAGGPTAEADTAPPSWWVEMYGDSDASKQAWGIQREANENLKKEARDYALEAVREELTQEDDRISGNLDEIESSFASLEDAVGRPLTEKEQSAVLDIVDEYTPKDEDGNYLGAPLDFAKAWEIKQLKAQAKKAPAQKARDEVAAVSAASNTGDASVGADRDKDFNPLDWNSFKRRL